MITLKAYAKINLGLDVLGKLDNGYHIVKMIMQSIDLYDELFGINTDGIALLIDMQNRRVHVSTSGAAISAIRDRDIEAIIDAGYEELRNDRSVSMDYLKTRFEGFPDEFFNALMELREA